MSLIYSNLDVVDIAESIKHYLGKRPDAADTLEGVANWWLLRQRYEIAMDIVQEALDVLIKQGVVTTITPHGSEIIYKLKGNP
ncbi:MAG: hypothetical protein HKP58_09435 [Desulfatitalea sp.]|nr:hypothetical protein [Desulfatitalea sp.]NNK00624.1 hypothetical protein [Desulfatitalea sp.]